LDGGVIGIERGEKMEEREEREDKGEGGERRWREREG
jgi:hypothetical protein